MRELNVGNEAWLAVAGVRQESVICPVCAGNRSVTVTLGSGSLVIVECDYCRSGYEGSQGRVYEYTHAPKAERVTITSKRVEEENGARRVEYHSALHFIGSDPVLFETEAEALAKAASMAAETDRYERDRREHRKGQAIKRVGWTAGYHIQKARNLREEAERHERWAREIKAETAKVSP